MGLGRNLHQWQVAGETWASVKSFQPKNKKSWPPPDNLSGNPTVSYRGEKHSNETRESKSDPEAQLARKGPGKEAEVELQRESAGGESQRFDCVEPGVGNHRHGGSYAALEMLQDIPGSQRVTVGGDKGFDTADFVASAGTFG